MPLYEVPSSDQVLGPKRPGKEPRKPAGGEEAEVSMVEAAPRIWQHLAASRLYSSLFYAAQFCDKEKWEFITGSLNSEYN